ncbi:MAG: VWA domain-containing protein [Vicinamibacteria bacterium]
MTRGRWAGPGAALAVIVLAVSGAPAQTPRVPTFAAETRLVTIDAIVLDKDGRPVPGLTAADFRVQEDGVAREVASFEAFDLGGRPTSPEAAATPPAVPIPGVTHAVPPGARSFVLLVDDFALSPAHRVDVQKAVERFATDGLRDGDELLLTTTSGDLFWTARMPEGREDVRALAARIRARRLSATVADYMSDWEAFQITRTASPTGANLESAGVSAVTTGPPGSNETFGAAVAAPGTNLMERVVGRWMERRVCDPLATEMCRAMVISRAHALDQARANRTRDVLSRVDQAVYALSPQKGRKALLLLSEGFLNDPDLDVARVVAGRCREANLAVYFIDVRGLMTGMEEMNAASGDVPNSTEMSQMRQEQVEYVAAGTVALAEDTGGAVIRDSNDLGGAAVRVADESRVYYLLGIAAPPGKGPRDWRSLKVTTTRSGLKVRARRGYTLRSAGEADREERAKVPEGAKEPVPVEVRRALGSGVEFDDLPVRGMAFAFGPRPGGRVRTVVALEADLSRIANLGGDERPATSVSLSVVVTDRDTGEVKRTDEHVKVDAGQGGPALEGWLSLRREFELAPGVHQARVVVRDEFLGRTGATTIRFEVPPADGFRLSTPVLTDRAVTRPGLAPKPVFLARRTFGTRGTLYGQIEVYGAPASGALPPAQVEATFALESADGTPVRTGPPAAVAPDEQGRLVQTFQMALDGLRPGDYRLVLKAKDEASGATVERVEPLRLD